MGTCFGKEERVDTRQGRSHGGVTEVRIKDQDVGERETDHDPSPDAPQDASPEPRPPQGLNVDEVDAPLAVLEPPPSTPSSSDLPSVLLRFSLPTISSRRLIPINYAPAKDWSQCAYCDNPTGDRYDYFYCREMPLELLESFAEHGWWRTGPILFKPRMKEVCCPAYALRLPVADFVPSKSHRRVIRKWKQFLAHGDPRWEEREQGKGDIQHGTPLPDSGDGLSSGDGGDKDEVDAVAVVERVDAVQLLQTAVVGMTGRGAPQPEAEDSGLEISNANETISNQSQQGASEKRPAEVTSTEGSRESLRASGTVSSLHSHSQVKDTPTRKRVKKPVNPGRGPDPNKPPCRKAKVLRAERKQRKLASLRDQYTRPKTVLKQLKTLQELLQEDTVANPRHRLELKLLPCNPLDQQLRATMERAYQIYDKFQNIVHPGKVRFESFSDFEWGFFTSLVRNPSNKLMGTYHMHYYLDGELTMISILDILPQYVVSIYFFYDPDIRFLTPGIYTCLREVQLVQDFQREKPELQYYSLGYYNHSSPKVSYKRQFGPQQILCNETNRFVPLVRTLRLNPYCRLDEDGPEKEGRSALLDDIIVRTLYGPKAFRDLTTLQANLFRPSLTYFVAEAGSSATHRFAIEVAGML